MSGIRVVNPPRMNAFLRDVIKASPFAFAVAFAAFHAALALVGLFVAWDAGLLGRGPIALALTWSVPFAFCAGLTCAMGVCRCVISDRPLGHEHTFVRDSMSAPRDPSEGMQSAVLSEAQETSSILVVDVARLAQRLREVSPDTVLAELNGDTFLVRCSLTDLAPTAPGSTAHTFALVSYRQQRVATDDFTLGAEALRSVVERAVEAGVDGLWLDTWCYRLPGSYVHRSFCALLFAVVTNATLIIWLPRSRDEGFPSYQYRPWCSFEAAVVSQRCLPVVLASPLSRSQKAVSLFGSFQPVLPWSRILLPEMLPLAITNTALFAGLLLSVSTSVAASVLAGNRRKDGREDDPIESYRNFILMSICTGLFLVRQLTVMFSEELSRQAVQVYM